jgi:hypothetical protein
MVAIDLDPFLKENTPISAGRQNIVHTNSYLSVHFDLHMVVDRVEQQHYQL